jgi:hypothetical protein
LIQKKRTTVLSTEKITGRRAARGIRRGDKESTRAESRLQQRLEEKIAGCTRKGTIKDRS